MEFVMIFFVSFCFACGTPTTIENEELVPASTHVKSINVPYHSPVRVTGYAPAATILEAPVLRAYPYATEIKHHVAVAPPFAAVGQVLAPIKSAAVVPAVGPVKSSVVPFATEVKHAVPVIVADAAPVVPLEVAPAPAIISAEGPVKSSAIKAFSFATEVKHEVPVAAAPVQVLGPAVAAPIITESRVKSIHSPAIASHVVAHAPATVPVVKSIGAPVIVPKVVTHIQTGVPIVPVSAIAYGEGPVKSSAIKAFSFATDVRHGVPVAAAPVIQAPAVSAPLVKSIHAPASFPEVVPHAPAIGSLAKSIHSPVISPQVVRHIPAVSPLSNSIHTPVIARHAVAHAPAHLAKSIHTPASRLRILDPAVAPAIRGPLTSSYTTAIRYGVPSAVGVHAPALSTAGLLGAGYVHPAQLSRRLPTGLNINNRIYGGYGSYPRLYASLIAPGAALWRGHPVSSGVAYLGGISRGAFGYHPTPVHYQHHRSPIHGVWNYFRG